jgi:uncharacterized protein YcfL
MKLVYRSALLIAVLIVAACSSTSGMVATHKSGGDPQFAKHLEIHNSALEGDIIISDMKMRRTGGLLEVQVTLANQTGSDQNVQYRFAWFDDDNFEVDKDAGAWTALLMHGNELKTMNAIAPNPRASTYKLQVRELSTLKPYLRDLL